MSEETPAPITTIMPLIAVETGTAPTANSHADIKEGVQLPNTITGEIMNMTVVFTPKEL